MGTGWTFVPKADLHVVAVGCFPPAPPGLIFIEFWDGTNQIIASYEIPLTPPAVDVLYQPVDGLTLKSGSLYGISFLNPGLVPSPVRIYSRQDTNYARFSTSPFIAQFKNFEVNGDWSPLPASPENNSDWLFLGPTFQFQVSQSIALTEVSTNLVLSWPAQSIAYAVQQNQDLNSTNWTALTNAPVVVGSQNQVTIPRPQGTMFYRLLSQ